MVVIGQNRSVSGISRGAWEGPQNVNLSSEQEGSGDLGGQGNPKIPSRVGGDGQGLVALQGVVSQAVAAEGLHDLGRAKRMKGRTKRKLKKEENKIFDRLASRRAI